MALTLSSTAFQSEGNIPKQYTCEGRDASPALSWSGIPSGTKTFALIMDDPDAPVGTWVHWVIYNLPANLSSLAEGMMTAEILPNGTKQGLNDFKRIGYGGPCPPPGKPHRYFFKLYALDAEISLPPKATKAQLLQAMTNHVLAETYLMGKYQRGQWSRRHRTFFF